MDCQRLGVGGACWSEEPLDGSPDDGSPAHVEEEFGPAHAPAQAAGEHEGGDQRRGSVPNSFTCHRRILQERGLRHPVAIPGRRSPRP